MAGDGRACRRWRWPLALPVTVAATATIAVTPAEAQLSLADALARAQANATSLTTAEARIALLARREQASIRGYLPSVELAFDSSDSVLLGAPDARTRVASATVSQLVFDGGRLRAARHAQRLQVSELRLERDQLREQVIDETWRTYTELQLLAARERVEEELAAVAASEVAIASRELQLGATTELQVAEAQLAAERAALQQAATALQRRDLEFRLHQLIGSAHPSAAASIALEPTVGTDYVGLALDQPPAIWRQLASAGNRELRRARAELELQQQRAQLADRAAAPEIRADLSFTVSGEALPLNQPGFRIGVALAFPESGSPVDVGVGAGVTAGGERTATTGLVAAPLEDVTAPLDRREAAVAVGAQRAELDRLQQRIEFDALQRVMSYALQRRELDAVRKQLELKDRRILILDRQLSLGAIKDVDLLRARTERLQMQIQLLEQILQIRLLERDIERVLGLPPGRLQTLP